MQSEYTTIKRSTLLTMFLLSLISMFCFVVVIICDEGEIKRLKSFTSKSEMVNLTHVDSISVENVGAVDYNGEFLDFPDRRGVYALRFPTDGDDFVLFTNVATRKKLAQALKECQ